MFGLFEIIGEMVDPGSVGVIEASAPEVKRRPSWLVAFHFAFSVALLLAVLAGIVYLSWNHWGWMALWLGIFCIYLLAAFYLQPTPDYDNLGWFGGIFNNPFRYSDDLNWFLFFFKILLLPGYMITTGIRDGYLSLTGQLPKHKKKKTRKMKIGKKPKATTFEQHSSGEGL